MIRMKPIVLVQLRSPFTLHSFLLYHCLTIDSPVITTPVQGSVLTTVFPTSPTATLICSSTGTPPANLNWYRHGVPIQCTNEGRDPVIISDDVFPPPNTTLSDRCNSFSSVAYSELAIANPRPEDGGVFTCLAVNSVGETSSTLYLQVNGMSVSELPHSMHVHFTLVSGFS